MPSSHSYMRLSPVVLIIVTVSSTVHVQLISSHYRTCWTQWLDWYCTNRSTTTSPATSEIDCTGCPFSSAWSTRSVCWSSSVFTRWHQSTLQWWATQFPPPLAEVISNLQHAVIWRYLGHERRLNGPRSFSWSVSGPSLWNSLLLSVRDPSLTMTQFCTHLKTFLFRRAYCT